MQLTHPAHDNNPVYPASITLLISACFFLSGLAGLVYEVVWARQLGLFLGITSYAHTAVITAYMSGLAAGSLYFGRRADRSPQPLRLYAWLEIGVGVYAAMTPWLFKFLQFAYTGTTDVSEIGEMSGYLSRFSIALLALLIPTFLMGGTLPLLVRGFVTELPGLGRVTGRFYGINTLGAMLGTLTAGYLLLPVLGINATILTGVAINIGVAVVVLAMLHRFRHVQKPQQRVTVTGQRPEKEPGAVRPAGLYHVLWVGFGLAGFASLLTQMAWIRALILVVGGSVYAFTITLASFLAGIGLGSLFYIRFLASSGGRLAGFGLDGRMVQAALLASLISLTLLLGLPLIGQLPAWFLAGYAAGLKDSFFLFQLFIFGLSFSLMILPTLFMGALFPLVTVIWTRSTRRSGRGVGMAYAINASGTILGAFLGGLFILPWLGVQHSIMLAAGVYVLVALAFWLYSTKDVSKIYRHTVAGVAMLAFVIIGLSIPPWDKAIMVSGIFITPSSFIKQLQGNGLRRVVEKRKLLYYKEGLNGVVAVRLYRDNKALVINGKTDASSTQDLPTQIMLAQLPLALDRKAESALVIGLGSGITAGTLATNELIKDLTILEISDEVVEASAFFEAENYGVLKDSRVNLISADARNFLMASPKSYDLIISEPSNPWITGISNLFTDEFFKLAKSRLNQGGVMTQWFHTYSMSNTDLKIVLKTFTDNFKYVSVWSPILEDLVIMGSDQPYAISQDHDRGTETQVRTKELKRAGIHSDRDLVRKYLFGGDDLSRYVMGSSINSDNKPIIEFSAPRNLYTATTWKNNLDIIAYLEGQKRPVPVVGMVRLSSNYLDAAFMGLKISMQNGVVASEIRPQWLVSQLLLKKNGVRTPGGADSERVLSWMEGHSRYRIQANWQATAPDKKELPDLLKTWTDSTGRKGGVLHRAHEFDALWLMNTIGEGSQLQLDIAWACKAGNSGFTHYSFRATLPLADEDVRGELPMKLANRFHCY